MKKQMKRLFSAVFAFVVACSIFVGMDVMEVSAVLKPEYLFTEDEGKYVCTIGNEYLDTAPGETYIYHYFDSPEEHIEIPSTIKRGGEEYVVVGIYDQAFQESSFVSVVIPETITKTGIWAFAICPNLETVEVRGVITEMGPAMFMGCPNLETVTFPENTPYISMYSFAGCSSLKEIDLPEGMWAIGAGAFAESGALERVDLPSSLTHIYYGAFYKCSSLLPFELPDGLELIDVGAFIGCDNFEKLTIPESVQSMGYGMFSQTSAFNRLLFLDSDAPTFQQPESPSSEAAYILEGDPYLMPARTAGNEGIAYVPVHSKANYMEIETASVGWKVVEYCYVSEKHDDTQGDVVIAIDPADGIVPNTLSVAAGEDVFLTVTPKAGYVIDSVTNAVLVDSATGKYAIESIDDNIEVVVTFKMLEAHDIVLTPAVDPLVLQYGQTDFDSPVATCEKCHTDFTYSSSDESVVKVNPTTGELMIVGVGTATITVWADAKDDCLAASTTYDVKVLPAAPISTPTTKPGGGTTVTPQEEPEKEPEESEAPKPTEAVEVEEEPEVPTGKPEPTNTPMETEPVPMPGPTVHEERFQIEQLPKGYTVEKITFDEFMIFDEFGAPLGIVKVPEGMTLDEMDLLEAIRLLEQVKVNPATGDNGAKERKVSGIAWWIGAAVLGFAALVPIAKKRSCEKNEEE